MITENKRTANVDAPVENWGYLENWKSTASI